MSSRCLQPGASPYTLLSPPDKEFGRLFLDFTGWGYAGIFFVVCVFFTYFYTAIAVNPKEMADTMKRQGGFVPGIRQLLALLIKWPTH